MKESKLHILIVEDESLLALELATTIKNYGYDVVDYVTTPSDARETLQKEHVNLIIMDINLNTSIDGIDFYKSLDTDSQVIYITAYRDDKTVSKAVETEPLGYLIKPHNEDELMVLLKLADVKLKHQSQKQQSSEVVELSNDYTFDMISDMLYHRNHFVKLSSKKLKLLKLLIQAKGNIVSFKTIEDELWQDTPPSESSIRTLIYRLRAVLQADMIESELNYGIKLV